MPLSLEHGAYSVPRGGFSLRENRLSEVTEEDVLTERPAGKKEKRNKEYKGDNKSVCLKATPTCNLSISSLSRLSKTNKFPKKILKKTEFTQSESVQAAELSSSHFISKNKEKQASSKTLDINSSLFKKIMAKKSDQSSEFQSPKNLININKTERSEEGPQSKFLNIALSNAKNINMFEINNYFGPPPAKDSKADKSNQEKLSNKSEIIKNLKKNYPNSSKYEFANKTVTFYPKFDAKKLVSKQPKISSKMSLQEKLSTITAQWKNRQQEGDT